MKLTAQERTYWGKYLRRMADLLDLRDWTFVLMHDLIEDEPNDEDNIVGAQVNFIDGRRRATVQLGEVFLKRATRKEQRQMMAHELLHCHFGAAWRHVENDLEVFLGKPTFTAFFNSFERNMEHGIDATAEALAKHLPLPPVIKPAKATRRKTTRVRDAATRKRATRKIDRVG